MQILARAVGRRKEAVAQVQIVKGSGLFVINDKPAEQYLQNNSCSLISVKSPFLLCQLLDTTVVASSLAPALPLATKDGNAAMAVSPLENSLFSFDQVDTIVKVKGGGLIGQADAIKLAVSRAICNITDLRSVHNSNTIKSLGRLDTNSNNNSNAPRAELSSKNVLANNSGRPPSSVDLLAADSTGLLPASLETGLDSLSSLENNNLDNVFKKQLKTKGYLTQDSRVKERRKYGLKKARKASQYHKR